MLRPLLESMPLSVCRLVTKRDVLVFFYHVVSDQPLPHIQHLYQYKTARMFENDLTYLAENYNLASYEQLAAHRAGGQRLKPGSAILTFDDGLSECYSVARPLLLKHGIPCTFFITTDYIGNHRMGFDHKASLCIDRVMSLKDSARSDAVRSINDALGKKLDCGMDFKQWIMSAAAHEHSTIDHLCQLLEVDVQRYLETRRPYMTSYEIERLVGDGFTIGAHSVSHRKLDSLTGLEVEEDVVASCKAIMSLSGKSQVPFAFPYSADGLSRDMLRELRRRHGHIGLFFDTNGIRADRDFIINRICGDPPTGSDQEETNLPRILASSYRLDLERRALRLRKRIRL